MFGWSYVTVQSFWMNCPVVPFWKVALIGPCVPVAVNFPRMTTLPPLSPPERVALAATRKPSPSGTTSQLTDTGALFCFVPSSTELSESPMTTHGAVTSWHCSGPFSPGPSCDERYTRGGTGSGSEHPTPTVTASAALAIAAQKTIDLGPRAARARKQDGFGIIIASDF